MIPETHYENGYNFQEIDSTDVSLITDSTYESILDDINAKYKKIRFWPFFLLVSIVLTFVSPPFILMLLVTPIVGLIDSKRKTIYLIYDIAEEQEQSLQEFYNSFEEIKNSQIKWHISSEARLNSTIDHKMNAGASSLIKRKSINIKNRKPKYFKTNVEVPNIPVGTQNLFFFPDRLFIIEKRKVGTINYKELNIEFGNSRFIETEQIARDTEIVDYTWKYVNKKGGPDKRFKDNPKLPITLYTSIHFTSKSGLNELIQLSKPNLGKSIQNAIVKLQTSIFI